MPVGIEHGLKRQSSIHCDELISIPKRALTHFIGTLPVAKIESLGSEVL